MFKRLFIVIIVLMMAMPVIAQDLSDTELDYLDEINAALEATLALDSFKISGEQLIEQVIEVSGAEVEQDQFMTIEGSFVDRAGDRDAYIWIEQEVAQTSGGFEVEVLLTQELLILGDDLYVQFSDISPSDIEDLYPDEWELFDDASEDYEGLAVINAEQYLRLLDSQQLTAPFAAMTDIISEIEQLDDEEIDGQDMRVYRATFDASLLFSDDYIDEAMSVMNFGSLGVNTEDLDIEIDDDAVVEYIYYIGQDNGLLHRIETEGEMTVTLNGRAFGTVGDVIIEQEFEAFFTYYDFDVAVKLPKP